MNTKQFTYSLIIKENHLDAFGHVNNATYLMLFEAARWDMLLKNGYGLEKMKETGLGPTILEIKIVFLKELRLNEEVEIKTQLISYEKKIGKLSQKMLRNGEVCCEAEFIIGLFDLQTRKLIAPTEDWLRTVGVL